MVYVKKPDNVKSNILFHAGKNVRTFTCHMFTDMYFIYLYCNMRFSLNRWKEIQSVSWISFQRFRIWQTCLGRAEWRKLLTGCLQAGVETNFGRVEETVTFSKSDKEHDGLGNPRRTFETTANLFGQFQILRIQRGKNRNSFHCLSRKVCVFSLCEKKKKRRGGFQY